jgi:hypothetical protein
MTQISRPFQIALAAAGLLLAVWFVALRGHSSSPESSPPASTTPAASSSTDAAKPGSGRSVYHGSAPGVEGLTRDIAKARGAVAASERNAKQLEQKSAQASGKGETGGSSAPASVSTGAHSAPAATRAHSRQPRGAAASGKAGAVSNQHMQRTVEGELGRGELVAILLWNPAGSVDNRVKGELKSVARSYRGKLAVHSALPNQVGAFGSFTRAIQIYSTPTIVLVNKHGQASTVAGLTDAFSLKQAIQDAR